MKTAEKKSAYNLLMRHKRVGLHREIYAYMTKNRANVTTNAREIARHEIRINEIEKTAQLQAVMLGRIDENIKAIRDADV